MSPFTVCLDIRDQSEEDFMAEADRSPDYQEIGRVSFVPEKWGSNKIVVQCRHGLPFFDRSKFHEWGFILGLQNERGAQVHLLSYQHACKHSVNSRILTLGTCSSSSVFLR